MVGDDRGEQGPQKVTMEILKVTPDRHLVGEERRNLSFAA